MRAGVAIVGGGSTGLFAAYYLRRLGYEGEVVILDRSYLGSGSTGRCAGGIRASFTSDVHVALMRESIKEWLRLRDEAGLPFRQSGYLWLLTTEELVKQHEALQRLHNQLGVPTRMLYGEEVLNVVPSMKLGDVIAALHDPTAGKISPLKTVWIMRKNLLKLGVKILEYVGVEEIVTKGGEAVTLKVSGGGEVDVEDGVIVAAGYWSKELLGPLGYEPPLKGDPHHLMITEKYAPFIEPLVIHKASGSYIVQVSSGGVILGTEYPVPENDLSIHLGFIGRAVRYMSRYFPQILEANLLRVWTGYYIKTPDHHPIIGRVPGYSNIYFATGYSGHGFMMAPIVGKELANYVMKGWPSLSETRKLVPERYERGELLEEKAIFG